MANRFHEPGLRLLIGAVFIFLVWVLYIVRIAFGIGPMRDDSGQQAPAAHYLAGALIVTGIVAAWNVLAYFARPRRGTGTRTNPNDY